MGRHRQPPTELAELGVEPIHDGRRLVGTARALIEWFETEEEQALIRAVAVEARAADDPRRRDVLLLLENRRDLPAKGLGLVEGGAVLQLEDAEAIALVLLRDESGGQGAEGDGREHDAAREPGQDQLALGDQEGHQTGIALLKAGEEDVEPLEDQGQTAAGKSKRQNPHHIGTDAEGRRAELAEGQAHHDAADGPAPAPGLGGLLRLQNQARHHRREGEGIEGGDGDRKGDREGELPVDDADAAGVEGHRHKHRHQHQRGGDQGADQLPHAGQCRLARLHTAFEIFGHGLDHHDRVIHHQPGGQHQAQQGELVDRETEGLDEGKGAHQRDRDRQTGHDRGPPVLQKQEQDHQHQHDRQPQRIGDAVDRRFNELADVVDLRHGDARWHLGRELIDQGHHRLRHLQGVAVGCLIDPHDDGGIAIHIGALGGEGVEAVAGLAHIAEAQQIALG